ncbi:MAG: hypothetical protein ICV83_31885 [Cytophagales bacterium]|nr:hypothetical protein [Cytophagales bacterium]
MQKHFNGSAARPGRVSLGTPPQGTSRPLRGTRQHLKMYLCILVIVALSLAFPFFCQAQETVAESSSFRPEGNRSKSVRVGGTGYSF